MPETPRSPRLQVVGVVQPPSPRRRAAGIGLKVLVFVILPLMVLTAALYVMQYWSRALPGTYVGNLSVAGLNQAELVSALEKESANTTVTINFPDGPQTLDLGTLGLSIDAQASAKAVFADHRTVSNFLNPGSEGHRFLPILIDEAPIREKAAHTLTGMHGGKEPQNAQVYYEASIQEFQVAPDIAGLGVTPSALFDAAKDAALQLSSTTVDLAFVELAPAITSADLGKVSQRANAMLHTDLAVQVGRHSKTPSTDQRASWITFEPANADTVSCNGTPGATAVCPQGAQTTAVPTPKVDTSAVQDWLTEIGKPLETPPIPGIRIKNVLGNVTWEGKDPVEGAQLAEVKALAENIGNAIDTGQTIEAELSTEPVSSLWEESTFEPDPATLVYKASGSKKWIDVNLTTNQTTAYEGATPVIGPIPSVHGRPWRPTPVGNFSVRSKISSQTMRGLEDDGETEYVTPGVPWILYFYGDYALHGAYWRSNFTYPVYLGSHGCVNLPVKDSKTLYDWASIGTPVIVHR
ncbi:MAG: L,D-transpeptidase [Actinomycetaceae bacterium]|nr:L,D-transpeptidase [Actinomycetaceae bacterium]